MDWKEAIVLLLVLCLIFSLMMTMVDCHREQKHRRNRK